MSTCDLSRIYALVVMLIETIFMFFSIKYYNDEKYGWIYQPLGVLSEKLITLVISSSQLHFVTELLRVKHLELKLKLMLKRFTLGLTLLW